MNIKLNPGRKLSQKFSVMMEGYEEKAEFIVNFEFPYSEDQEYKKDYLGMITSGKVQNQKDMTEEDMQAIMRNNAYVTRKSISSWEGIDLPSGGKLPFNTENQKAVYEMIKSLPEFEEVMDFKNGLSTKNFNAGATQK